MSGSAASTKKPAASSVLTAAYLHKELVSPCSWLMPHGASGRQDRRHNTFRAVCKQCNHDRQQKHITLTQSHVAAALQHCV